MAKRTEMTTQTKQNIMDAFWELYCEQRIEKITVKDITNKAGYNRSTFYEYFKDPYDVLEQLEAMLIPNLDGLPPLMSNSFTMGMPIDLFMAVYKNNRKYYAVLLGDNGDPAFASKLKRVIKPIIKDALQEKVACEPVMLDYMLEYTLTAMIGIMSYWFSQSEPIPEELLYGLLQRLMSEGVLNVLIQQEAVL